MAGSCQTARSCATARFSGTLEEDLSRQATKGKWSGTALSRARPRLSAYADTSFLVSLYMLDANSSLAAARMEEAKLPILLTPLGELEFTNAISSRLFRRELQTSKVKAAQTLLRTDLAEGILQLKPLTTHI